VVLNSKSVYRYTPVINTFVKNKNLAYSTALNATRFNTLLSGCVISIDDINGETSNGKNTKKKIKLAVDHLALKIQ